MDALTSEHTCPLCGGDGVIMVAEDSRIYGALRCAAEVAGVRVAELVSRSREGLAPILRAIAARYLRDVLNLPHDRIAGAIGRDRTTLYKMIASIEKRMESRDAETVRCYQEFNELMHKNGRSDDDSAERA